MRRNEKLRRILVEISLLARRFGIQNVEYDQEFEWIIVHNFPLPEGYNANSTDTLIFIPIFYPILPPNGMAVSAQLEKDGQPISTKSGLKPKTWRGWVYFFLDMSWTPTHDLQSGDNLLTAVNKVYEFLEEL